VNGPWHSRSILLEVGPILIGRVRQSLLGVESGALATDA
jgi:hypothetical protein